MVQRAVVRAALGATTNLERISWHRFDFPKPLGKHFCGQPADKAIAGHGRLDLAARAHPRSEVITEESKKHLVQGLRQVTQSRQRRLGELQYRIHRQSIVQRAFLAGDSAGIVVATPYSVCDPYLTQRLAGSFAVEYKRRETTVSFTSN